MKRRTRRDTTKPFGGRTRWPRTMSIFNRTYRISLVDADAMGEAGLYGAHYASEREIFIDRSLAPAERWYMLLHEVTHALNDVFHAALLNGDARCPKPKR